MLKYSVVRGCLYDLWNQLYNVYLHGFAVSMTFPPFQKFKDFGLVRILWPPDWSRQSCLSEFTFESQLSPTSVQVRAFSRDFLQKGLYPLDVSVGLLQAVYLQQILRSNLSRAAVFRNRGRLLSNLKRSFEFWSSSQRRTPAQSAWFVCWVWWGLTRHLSIRTWF